MSWCTRRQRSIGSTVRSCCFHCQITAPGCHGSEVRFAAGSYCRWKKSVDVEVNRFVEQNVAAPVPGCVAVVFLDVRLFHRCHRVIVEEQPAVVGFDDRYVVTVMESSAASARSDQFVAGRLREPALSSNVLLAHSRSDMDHDRPKPVQPVSIRSVVHGVEQP